MAAQDSFLKRLRRSAVNGVAQFLTDAGLLFIGPKSPFGYGTGAGGSVTQGTNKTTAITLNTTTGLITWATGSLAGYAATSSATWTNSALTSYSVVAFTQTSGTLGAYKFHAKCSAGTAQLCITNLTSAAINEVVQAQFVVFNGAIT